MKQTFSKIVSILLALLVLFSTFSFTVEKHYCGEFLMDVSFTGDAEDCGMNMEKVRKKCCKDEVHQIDGQDELQQTSPDDFNFQKQQFLVALTIAYHNLFLEKESDKSIYKDFPPPDNLKDFQVLYQSFLI